MENLPPTLESFEDVVQNDIIIENLNEIGEVIFTFDEGLFEEILGILPNVDDGSQDSNFVVTPDALQPQMTCTRNNFKCGSLSSNCSESESKLSKLRYYL